MNLKLYKILIPLLSVYIFIYLYSVRNFNFSYLKINLNSFEIQDNLNFLNINGSPLVKKLDGYKQVLLWTPIFGVSNWSLPLGEKAFQSCTYTKCFLTTNKSLFSHSSALLIHLRDLKSPKFLPNYHPSHQSWIFFLQESQKHACDIKWPFHSWCLEQYDDVFNWTSTFLFESDIPCPYGFYHQIPEIKTGTQNQDLKDHQHTTNHLINHNKTKLAVTFITNCAVIPNYRLEFLGEFRQHLRELVYTGKFKPRQGRDRKDRSLEIDVQDYTLEVHGKCAGKNVCFDSLEHPDKSCESRFLSTFKFFFAFENSNCRGYVTEKMFTALREGLVPVVYGARYRDYLRVAPPGSFIFVSSPLNDYYYYYPKSYHPFPSQAVTYYQSSDKLLIDNDIRRMNSYGNNHTVSPEISPYHPFFNLHNLRNLAEYLLELNANDTLYQSFHAWRLKYRLGPIPGSDSDYQCQICRHLHLGDIPLKSYKISQWWNEKRDCNP